MATTELIQCEKWEGTCLIKPEVCAKRIALAERAHEMRGILAWRCLSCPRNPHPRKYARSAQRGDSQADKLASLATRTCQICGKELPSYRRGHVCQECQKAKQRATYAEHKDNPRPKHSPAENCPRCRTNKKHVNSNGKRMDYCLTCMRDKSRERRSNARARAAQPLQPRTDMGGAPIA